jgi:hypothetical protein
MATKVLLPFNSSTDIGIFSVEADAALANLSFWNPCFGHDIMTMDKRRSP